ncbi:hypothetical protein D4764_0247700 [Takifugu flavidus]|uniref:Uncharacterized protein n=1 Tax=Takifugu flavidus TaxID=433684 RepID=A0A5C6MFG3_9TELE|nr:hypothetical protein D4764_0247700 [Takifugu flavidus]
MVNLLVRLILPIVWILYEIRQQLHSWILQILSQVQFSEMGGIGPQRREAREFSTLSLHLIMEIHLTCGSSLKAQPVLDDFLSPSPSPSSLAGVYQAPSPSFV